MFILCYDTTPVLASVESPVLDGEEGRGLSRIHSVFLASSFPLSFFSFFSFRLLTYMK